MMDAGDSKTSSVTSISESPNFSWIRRPISVLASWKAGRQCMNFEWRFPVPSITARVTR
jgi:hypothetical protein